MDLSKLRQRSEEGRRNLQKQKEEEEKQKVFGYERRADEAIARVSEIVNECAASGQNSARIFTVHFTEFVGKPKERIWRGKKKNFSPRTLPSYARRVFDHLEAQGFNTLLVDDGYELKFFITVEW